MKFNLFFKQEEENKREILNSEILSKLKKFDCNNKDNLKHIKYKIMKRNNRKSESFQQHQLENSKEDFLNKKNIKLKPLQRYEKRVILKLIQFINLHSSSADSIQPNKEIYQKKLIKVLQNIEEIEEKRKQRNNNVLKKYLKAEKQNSSYKVY